MKPRKPKLRKMPKRPLRSRATVAAMRRYKQRVAEVKRDNAAKLRAYAKAEREYRKLVREVYG